MKQKQITAKQRTILHNLQKKGILKYNTKWLLKICQSFIATVHYSGLKTEFQQTGIRKCDWNLRNASSICIPLRSTSSEKHLHNNQ